MINNILLLSFLVLSTGVNLFGQNDQPPVVNDVLPKFPGGELEIYKYVYANIRLPQEAKAKGISGSVPVVFVIDSSGHMQNIHIEEGKEMGYGLDEEAIRVVTLMSENYVWSPGEHQGRKVNVTYTLPIKFVR